MKSSESLSRKDGDVSSLSFPSQLSGCFCISPPIVRPCLISQNFSPESLWPTSFEDLSSGLKSILIESSNQRRSRESNFVSHLVHQRQTNLWLTAWRVSWTCTITKPAWILDMFQDCVCFHTCNISIIWARGEGAPFRSFDKSWLPPYLGITTSLSGDKEKNWELMASGPLAWPFPACVRWSKSSLFTFPMRLSRAALTRHFPPKSLDFARDCVIPL